MEGAAQQMGVLNAPGLGLKAQLVGLALFCWFCSAWRLEMLAMLSLIPLYLYNGERGFSNKALQYCFYAFYPVHILILSVLDRSGC